MQNQVLINELRAHATKCQVEMHIIETVRDEIGQRDFQRQAYAQLLQAKAASLNGIAVLVAANKVVR